MLIEQQCDSTYGTYVFIRCFCDFTSGGRKLTTITYWQATCIYYASGPIGAEGNCTTLDEPIEAKERRRPSISSSKERRNCGGDKLRVWQQLREQVRKLAHAPDPQLISLKRTGKERPAHRTNRGRVAWLHTYSLASSLWNKAAVVAIAKATGRSSGKPHSLPLKYIQRQQRQKQQHQH